MKKINYNIIEKEDAFSLSSSPETQSPLEPTHSTVTLKLWNLTFSFIETVVEEEVKETQCDYS